MKWFLGKIDWLLILSALFIAVSGLIMLSSSAPHLFWKQSLFIAGGLLLVFSLAVINLSPLVGSRKPIMIGYLMSLLLLALVPFIGISINGSRSWISLGAINIQPSEFVKVALILVFAAFFSKRHVGISRLDVIFKSFLYFFIPVILVFKEPDWGSALIIFGLWFGYLIAAGLPFKYFLYSFLACGVLGLGAWQFALKDYQKERIIAVFNPNYDPLGINYNVIQSKNAIGSGGLLGKGFKQGEVVQLGFLPAAQTDFAFSSFFEEWGFLGGMLVISAFSLMMYRITIIGLNAKANFYKFVCLGTMIFLSLHFVVNMGSAIGFLPVIGVVFPFLSYGGSNMLASFLLLALVNNVSKK